MKKGEQCESCGAFSKGTGHVVTCSCCDADMCDHCANDQLCPACQKLRKHGKLMFQSFKEPNSDITQWKPKTEIERVRCNKAGSSSCPVKTGKQRSCGHYNWHKPKDIRGTMCDSFDLDKFHWFLCTIPGTVSPIDGQEEVIWCNCMTSDELVKRAAKEKKEMEERDGS